MTTEQLARIKREFKQYLINKHPEWKESTVSTFMSDSMFALNQNVGISFWDCFKDNDSMETAYNKIQSFFLEGKYHERATERADGYLRAMRHLKDFIDSQGGVEAYSAYISTPASWIFQGNLKYYDVFGAVNAQNIIQWRVKQYYKQIKKGDKVYIWVSGSDGGIIASGTILCDPETKKTEFNDPFSRTKPDSETYLAVDIEIERKFIDKIVKRAVLQADNRTNRMEVITYPGATNYPLTKEHISVIESIIAGTYENVPTITGGAKVVTEKKQYWMYAPGEGSRFWEEFYTQGIMGIGWEKLGDLKAYPSKDAMKEKMKEIYGDEYSYKNAGHATWQFANEIKIGDVVFVKKGMTKIIGRGIITSDYFFDESRDEYNSTRKVEWTHKGEWEYEGQIILKALTNITPYTDYYKGLEDLFESGHDDTFIDEEATKYESYTTQDFLSEVYMNKDQYTTVKSLLQRKKNIILQGAPGVGKTFAAERLAYSIMGEKDTSRVMMVQFHQNYSYEDFVMGYRPTENGFTLAKGPFYKFCKEAEPDDREYFFIIDEINRGNLSKIFGELLMLIEYDKRGKQLRLVYSDEQFSVPKNVYIIGMMNTADRSLAMIDYALRRRFAFYEFDPAFSSEGFRKYSANLANQKFDSLINAVSLLNDYITNDTSLGSGFRIGHSYFCTDEEVTDTWLSNLVEYELIPLINEYWFDEPSKVEQWTRKLRGAVHD